MSAGRGPVTVCGIDFSSAPSARKPIVVAHGQRDGGQVRLQRLARHPTLADWSLWLARPAAWVGAFDLPFGWPRELVLARGWPQDWEPLMRHVAGLDRARLREQLVAFCADRPVGQKFAHRATDRPAGSSPSMKWVNPPVAYMLHAGVPRLLNAGVSLPGLCERPGETRIALEGYPGLLARELIGRRPYKSDTPARQSEAQRQARAAIVAALRAGQTRLQLRLEADEALLTTLVDDPRGDALDAVLCLLQAGWACDRPRWGLPADLDPLEGWIVSAG